MANPPDVRGSNAFPSLPYLDRSSRSSHHCLDNWRFRPHRARCHRQDTRDSVGIDHPRPRTCPSRSFGALRTRGCAWPVSVPRTPHRRVPTIPIGLVSPGSAGLPGAPSGFALLEPLDGEWELAEGIRAEIPGHDTVTLDVAIVARVNPVGRSRRGPHALLGLPPGQLSVRGSGTRFCVSGPFPDTVPDLTTPRPTGDHVDDRTDHQWRRHRLRSGGTSWPVRRTSVWESPLRTIPLPE